jgi:hypothetical protein
MGLLDLIVPPRRRRLSQYKTDWNGPELQPIAGVSLQKYVEVTQGFAAPGGIPTSMAAMAEEAGGSQADWTTASLGWQQRQTTSQDVRVAITKIIRPDASFRRGQW